MVIEEESTLVAELRHHHDDAYERLVRSHFPTMFRITRRILGNDDDATEAVQEAFLSAFRSLDAFDQRCRLSTWLYRIAVNAALMHRRKTSNRHERSIDDLLPKFLEDGHAANPAVEWRELPDDHALREETRAKVRNAIDELPETYRTVLVLRDIEELDTDESAAILGVTAGVVKVRLHRARQALRSLLDPWFSVEAP